MFFSMRNVEHNAKREQQSSGYVYAFFGYANIVLDGNGSMTKCLYRHPTCTLNPTGCKNVEICPTCSFYEKEISCT